MNLGKNLKIPNLLIFVLIPVVFIAFASGLKNGIKFYFLTAVDPEMAYLYNSLAILHGHYTHFVDHPGIPLQYIGAFVILVMSFFRPKESIIQDVVSNPDFYLHSINFFNIFLISVSLFALGYHTFKYSKSYFAGIFIQLTPFLSFSYISTLNRILPESLTLPAVAGIFIQCLLYLSTPENEKRKIKWRIFWMAIFTGIAVSLKVTYLPYVIIPLLLLRRLKERITFSLAFSTFAAFFLIPAINRGGYFFSWISRMFIHSGEYGSGNSDIVDFSLYKTNVAGIFCTDTLFAIALCLITGTVLYYYARNFFVKVENNSLFKLFAGFVFASLIITLVVTKNLKFYYLSPAALLVIPAITLLIINRQGLMRKFIFPIVFTLLLFVQFIVHANKFDFFKTNKTEEQRILTKDYIVKNINECPVIDVPDYYGSPFTGYSAYYGIAYSGRKGKDDIVPVLDRVFPHYYTYHNWNKLFNNWDEKGYILSELIYMYDSIYLYIGNNELFNSVWHNQVSLKAKMEARAYSVYNNAFTGEEIFRLYKPADSLDIWTLSCNAEERNPSGDFFLNSERIELEGGYTQSGELSRSVKHCSKLTACNNYGFGVTLAEVQKGEKYSVSVWKFNNGNLSSSLVVEPVNNPDFYVTSNKILETKDNWAKIQIEIEIVEEIAGSEIKIYCCHYGDSLPAYFDDFLLSRLR